MSNTAPYDVIVGWADVYVAPVGTAFPTPAGTPSGSWTYLSRTSGGVKVQHTQNITLITVDQNTGPIKAVRTEEGLNVNFAFASLTLENYAKLMNNATVTSGGSDKTIPLHQGFDVAQFALLCRGPSPYGDFKMQYELPVTIQNDQPEVTFQREDKAVLQCTFAVMEDYNQTDSTLKYGVLRAATA